MRKQSGEVLFQRREPIEGVEQKRCCQVARLNLWIQKRGEVVKQSLVLGVEKTLIVVVGRDERRERHALEVGFDGSGSSDFCDANRQRSELQ